ncbi:MAG TPA: WbqC family protein, partial [Prevotella sp.]
SHGNWRHLHWNALLSAYGESPFFEFYADDIRPFYERKWEFLFDFNMEILHKMCELLDIEPNIRLTDDYIFLSQSSEEDMANHGMTDFRNAIHPKHPMPDAEFSAPVYYQVYARKHGFQLNMSILDLLFNEGNEAVLYL